MIDTVVSDIYKYICSYLNDKDYRSLTKTCRNLFNRRGEHLLNNYYSLNVLLQTGYNILCLDLIRKHSSLVTNISGLFMKRLHMIKFINVDSKFVNNLAHYDRSDVYITYYITDESATIEIPKNISNVIIKKPATKNINFIGKKASNLNLLDGLKMKSLTIFSNTNISTLDAPDLETLCIKDADIYSGAKVLDLRNFLKLRTIDLQCITNDVVFPKFFTSLSITFSTKGDFIINHLSSLRRLKINGQPTNKLRLPPNITYLELKNFNQEIELPNNLRFLKTDLDFNQTIILNEGLVEAHFGGNFNKDITLPSSLKTLVVGHNYASHITFNDNLEVFDIRCVNNVTKIRTDNIPDKTQIKLSYLNDIFKMDSNDPKEDKLEFGFLDSENDEEDSKQSTINFDYGEDYETAAILAYNNIDKIIQRSEKWYDDKIYKQKILRTQKGYVEESD